MNTIGADAYYSDLASPLELAKMALYVTQTILADSIIVSLLMSRVVLPSEKGSSFGDVM